MGTSLDDLFDFFFDSQWKANLVAFSRIAVGQSLTVNQLVDMEWRFGGKSCKAVCHELY